MTLRFLFFLTTQIAVVLAARNFDNGDTELYGFIYPGVLSSQFALLGIWLGVGSWNTSYRISSALLCVVGLCALDMLRSPFNGWELLLELVRLPVLGFVFISIRWSRQLVLRQTRDCEDAKLFRLALPQFAVLAVVAVLLFAFWQVLESKGAPYYRLVLPTLLFGAGGALAPLVVSLMTLSRRSPTSVAISVAVVFLLAFAMSCVGYFAGNAEAAGQWFSVTLIEAALTGASLCFVRYFGYCLATK